MARKWYVIHTYSGYENKVKANLEHRIQSMGMEDSIFDVRIPTETVTDLKAGLEWERWTVTAGVNNLFDKYYFNHLSYQRDPFRSGYKVPETGAFAYLTITYRY